MKVMNTANIMNNKLQAMVQLLINTQTKTEAIVILNTGKKKFTNTKLSNMTCRAKGRNR